MGTIKCGFWKLAFILSPDEFIEFIKFCLTLDVKPNDDNICKQYQLFYNSLIATNPPSIFLRQNNISFITLKSFSGGLSPKSGIGLSLGPANMVHWYYGESAVRIDHWAIQINLQKGVSINKEDEKGKYFRYEDIQLHSPQSFPLYQQITTYIKNITKPLRFKTNGTDEIKASVRISKKAAIDLRDSWIFKNHNFELLTFK